MRLQRYSGNPILSPHPDHPWEDLAVFNPGAWYDEKEGKVILLYRTAESHPEYKCFFGLAESTDGYDFRRVSDKPVFSPSVDGFDASTVQDPRIVKIGEWYYITYACRHFPFGQYWAPPEERYRHPQCPAEFPCFLRDNKTSTGLLLTRDFRTYIRAGTMTDPLLDDRDVILFPERIGGKHVMLHRPLEWVGRKYGTEHPAIWISESEDLLGFRESRLLAKGRQGWEAGKIGANTPPLRTEHGWLTLYHAVGEDLHYRIGALLLDLEEPGRILHRTTDFIFEPEAPYETDGFYRGCVFPCGKVVIGDTLFVYYGAGDEYVAVATCPLAGLLDYLLSCPP